MQDTSAGIKIPPQDMAAERAVLGCQMIDWQTVSPVREIISAADFFSDVHGIIQRAIDAVCEANDGRCDEMLVASYLEEKKQLGEIGGVPYVIQCLESQPHAAHAVYYATIVARHSRRRKAIMIGEQLINDGYDTSKDDEEIVTSAHDAAKRMASILKNKGPQQRSLKECISEVIDGYKRGEMPTVWWGIPEVDKLICGAMPGEMIVVGGSPGQGKSLLMLQWLMCAADRGIPGLIVSEEMPEKMIASRSISFASNIHPDNWRDSVTELEKQTSGVFDDKATIVIAHKCSTIKLVEAAIDRAVATNGIKIVGVDYAQIIRGDGETSEQRLADVSQRIKAKAMEHDLVVLLLSQLNRSRDNREGMVPRLSDLKGSGSLEADADVVIFPFWPWKLDQTYKEEFEFRIYLEKNKSRCGRERVAKMRIVPSRQRIEPWLEEPPPFDF